MESAHVRAPQWSWPASPDGEGSDSADDHPASESAAGSSADTTAATDGPSSHAGEDASTPPPPPPDHGRRERHYKPRTCRICLEVVNPTYDMDASVLPSLSSIHIPAAASNFFRRRRGGGADGADGADGTGDGHDHDHDHGSGSAPARPRVRYVSEDPSLGRLISPCRCKGSQRYVHAGCLQAWRQAAPLSDRNFWRCPTCGFEYRIERLRWGRWISSRATRVLLTVAAFTLSLFVLGFVADPIINLWQDPLGSLADGLLSDGSTFSTVLREELADTDENSWTFHFFKGVLSLGLLGFVKTFFTLFPWQWTVHRYIGGGRRRGRGQDRLQNINWGLVVIGVITFLAATWKGISYLSARALEKVSERVIDVQGEDDPDEDDDDGTTAANGHATEGASEAKKDQ